MEPVDGQPEPEHALEAARTALRQRSWGKAFELFNVADEVAPLAPEDLERLGEAAFWSAGTKACMEARERAYAAYVKAGEPCAAARVAFALASDYRRIRAGSVAAGWAKRAERLLAGEEERSEHGYLALRDARAAEARGDPLRSYELSEKAAEIARRHGDRDLEALALHQMGYVRLREGALEEGWALIDEATAAAVAGELDPHTTGVVYCGTISACRDLGDFRRAGEWTEHVSQWCDRNPMSGFPGVCRVHRAEVMRLRGAWKEAEQEARLASVELADFNLIAAGEAFYELGELSLRVGEFAAAEQAFRQAHELGREPQPGMALLRLVEGNLAGARSCITRALEDSNESLARSWLLPAAVEIALAGDLLEDAKAAAEELVEIGTKYSSLFIQASAACAEGAVAVAEGNPAAARQSLRRAQKLWQELDAPYEAAQARVGLALAYRASADEEAAQLEFHSARSTFERLGAAPATRQVDELLARNGNVAEPPVGRTFMFTDICNSTTLADAIGDDAWSELLRWHDETLRLLFRESDGEEVDHAGDGFFVSFDRADAALECAIAIQRKLAEQRRAHGFAPQVRIGLHAATAKRAGRGYRGKGVHAASRIAALAQGGEILASAETISATGAWPLASEPRQVDLKGVSEKVAVAAIDWRQSYPAVAQWKADGK